MRIDNNYFCNYVDIYFLNKYSFNKLGGLQPKWPLVLRSLPLPHAFYKSMYLEAIPVPHYNNHDGVIRVCVLKACVSSKLIYLRQQAYTLYYRHVCVSSSSFMYLCISCYCDVCLKSSALHVGVKTLHNTIHFDLNITKNITRLLFL